MKTPKLNHILTVSLAITGLAILPLVHNATAEDATPNKPASESDKIALAEKAKAEYEQAQKDKAAIAATFAEKERQKLEAAAKAQVDQEQNEKRKAAEAKAFEEKLAKEKAEKGKSE